MQDQVAELAEQGMALLPQERARLAELLLASLCEAPDASLDPAWNQEIVRRLAAYDRGDTVAIDVQTVFAKANKVIR